MTGFLVMLISFLVIHTEQSVLAGRNSKEPKLSHRKACQLREWRVQAAAGSQKPCSLKLTCSWIPQGSLSWEFRVSVFLFKAQGFWASNLGLCGAFRI